MDVSSDSEDTVMPLDAEPSDTEIEDILRKYTTTNNVCHSSLDIGNNYYNDKGSDNTTYQSLANVNSSFNEVDLELDNKLDNKLQLQEATGSNKQIDNGNRRKEKTLENTQKNKELRVQKATKLAEKEMKKKIMEKQKLMKNALRTVAKSTKPDECIKYITVELDSEFLDNRYRTVLMETLSKNGISFKTKLQMLPNIISWSRKIQTLDDMILKETEVSENSFMVILSESEFIEHINKNSLTIHIKDIFSLTKCKHLTVVIVGREKSKPSQEIAVIEAEMLTKSYFRFVKKIEDLGELVLQLTKAVAQIPHKLQKEEKHKVLSEYFNDSNKDTVKIDKNGNGLGRLWQQMLTMFPLARLETAEAITALYHTPKSLFQAYDSCEDKKEELLQNLPIRRAHGPCISARRIGPELSRKCFNFFCSTENILL